MEDVVSETKAEVDVDTGAKENYAKTCVHFMG